jgi:hypothetical protein
MFSVSMARLVSVESLMLLLPCAYTCAGGTTVVVIRVGVCVSGDECLHRRFTYVLRGVWVCVFANGGMCMCLWVNACIHAPLVYKGCVCGERTV